MRRRDAEEGPENPAQRQEKLLTASVRVLFGYDKNDIFDDGKCDAVELQKRFGMELVAQAEREIHEIAKLYRHQSIAYRQSVKFQDAIDQLKAVETALIATADAFDKLSHDAYNMLGGIGPMGTEFRRAGWDPRAHGGLDPELDFATLVRTTSRYAVPDYPTPPAAKALRDTHRLARARARQLAGLRRQLWAQQIVADTDPADRQGDACTRLTQRIDRLEAATSSETISWPEAVAALGEQIGVIWRDYEGRFYPEVFGLERALEYGPDGNLEAGRKLSIKNIKKLDRLSGPPSRMGDGGRNANVFELMYGRPENNFVNACYECFSKYNRKCSISTTKDSKFGSFVEIAFMYAIDAYEIPNENKGAGAGSAGLDHRIRNAVSIQEELIDLAMRTGKLSKEETQKLHSLRLAQVRGGDEKPIWMSRRPRAKTTNRARKNKRGEGP